MGMHKCLRAERSHINVETEPRTYCCGGGVAAGDRGEKSGWGGRVAKRFLGVGWQKLGVAVGKWQNLFSHLNPKIFCHPTPKYFAMSPPSDFLPPHFP